MQEDASPSQMPQQDGEIEVNATGSVGSPESLSVSLLV